MRLISGLILLVHSMLLYIPITYRTRKLFIKIKDAERWAFFSLFIMSFLFILLWSSVVIDMLWDMIFGVDPENMSFWGFFMATMVLGIAITSYLGFGLPKWFRKMLKFEE